MPTTFVIDRSKWRCGKSSPSGHGRGATRLLNESGFMCCLGQIAIQLGARPEGLLDILAPAAAKDQQLHTECVLTHGLRFGGCYSTAFTQQAMPINDDGNLTRIQRERKLERLAEEHGLRIEFTGKYTDE